MIFTWKDVQLWLADARLARQVMEAIFRVRSRRHLAHFDRQEPARCQRRILLGLVNQARGTQFGRDHDFRRIRTVADYRRLVPLCAPPDLWRSYWQPALPHLGGITWPGPLPHLATFRDVRNEKQGLVALSAGLQAAHRSAVRTALALAGSGQSRARHFAGTMLFLGEDCPVTATAALGDSMPFFVRPFVRVVPGPVGRRSGTTLGSLAEEVVHTPVTCLAGPLDRLITLCQRVKELAGKPDLASVWPSLATIFFSRRAAVASREDLCAEVGERVQLLETAFHPAGAFAVEDPRCGGLRLLFDHGIYFEVVRADEAEDPRARRCDIDEAEVGIPYELALTSPAGLWSCRIGVTLCFERLDPPVLRLLEPAPLPAAAPALAPRTDEAVTVQEPHRQSGGNSAAPPESIVHSPWSARADRG